MMKSESIFEWEEGDCLSFDDSDRFEEDSLCSWISEPESLCNNWRGWKRPAGLINSAALKKKPGPLSLVELAARAVATHIPFELVEDVYPPVPEQLQLRIAFWSFPENEEDIRLYSCLANGSAEEFLRGETYFRARTVSDPLQIGFHLSATYQSLVAQTKGCFNVAVTFDRGRITSCHCTCSSSASWCAHVVAVCLYRIHVPEKVCLRAPVSESLSRLRRDQLQKFAQYLISELPQQILPTAQRLLDELLSCQPSAINNVCGAPDPTAGASANEQTSWCLDDNTLHDNIRKILIKFCIPSPMVFSDVNYLSSTAPPAATEWSNLLRPLRGREPEGMWNLLSIVREMFRRHDRNAVPLLQILTDECLACEQILVWWFNTKVALHTGTNAHIGKSHVINNSQSSQHACSSLCDEIVVLWRLAALNPASSPQELKDLEYQLKQWHLFTLEKVGKSKNTNSGSSNSKKIDKIDMDVFPGFKPAIEACLLDWVDYPISGVTYSAWSRMYRCPVSCLKQHENNYRSDVNQVNCSQVVLNGEHPPHLSKRPRNVDFIADRMKGCLPVERQPKVGISPGQDGNRSSISSEGFCDNDSEVGQRDSQSDSVDETQTSHCSGQACVKSENNYSVSYGDDNVFGNALNTSDGSLNNKDQFCPDGNDIDSDCSGAVDTLCQLDGAIGAKCESVKQTSRNDLAEAVQSSDEYNLYYYDPKVKVVDPDDKQNEQSKKEDIFSGIKKMEDPLEILFARAEALHAHGHGREACKLAVKLAEELLSKPPVLLAEPSPPPAKGKRKRVFKYTVQPASHQVSLLAMATLAKAAFLCNVLTENSDHSHLAFKVGMYGLEMARPPASTKAIEVKLANQESEIAGLLKRIPLGTEELNVMREKAEQLRDGTLRSRGEALLPLMLASYIFEALALPVYTRSPPCQFAYRSASDQMLGFEAALAALGLKANVSEFEHPILCEGIRRQRGDLAVTLLVHYKDDKDKLAKLMDRLLDKEVHQMYKAKSLSSYYATRPNNGYNWYYGSTCNIAKVNCDNANEDTINNDAGRNASMNSQSGFDIDQKMSTLNLQDNSALNLQPSRGARSKEMTRMNRPRESSPTWEEDYKEWEVKFRCANLKTPKRHSNGMASIDSSAPETTSSDNSPTLIRRCLWTKPSGPGSDSGSSGKSSDSLGSFSSGDKISRDKVTPRENESPPLCYTPKPAPMVLDPSAVNRTSVSTNPNSKTNRYKGKRAYPTIPNQPSEASAYFMFELANTVLRKAGGNSSTSLFTQPTSSQNPRGPHRALHMCAFQIGLYALGLYNCVSPNWLSRTYSSHVSWVTGQAIEIGANAISFLIDTWEGHLTPPEIANLADRISRSRDPVLVRAAVELALSCLPHAHALNPSEIQRAILQCKELSVSHLERACLAVESAAKGDGVPPEVLFYVSKRWYELYEKNTPKNNPLDNIFLMDGKLYENVNLEMGMNQHPIMPHPLPVAQPQPPSSNPGLAYLHHPLQLSLPYSMYNFVPSFSPPIGQVPFSMYLPASGLQYGTNNNVGVNVSVNMGLGLGQQYPNVMGSPPTLPFFSPSNLRPIGLGANQPNSTGNGILPITIQPTNPVLVSARPSIPVHNVSLNQPDGISTSSASSSPGPTPVPPRSVQPINQIQLNYLLSAYRVGMLAMETLTRRVHDDRPQFKYAKSPPYGVDVKWLLGVTKKLGSHYLHQFCICTLNSVVSPFVLHEIAIEAAHYMVKTSGSNVMQHLRSPFLVPLVQKCQQMFIQCTHQKLYQLAPSDYDDFISIIKSARAAFQMTPGGLVQFNELLQSLKRSKSCRKDLWVKIASNLQQSSTV